jgi:hypothetical protein
LIDEGAFSRLDDGEYSMVFSNDPEVVNAPAAGRGRWIDSREGGRRKIETQKTRRVVQMLAWKA